MTTLISTLTLDINFQLFGLLEDLLNLQEELKSFIIIYSVIKRYSFCNIDFNKRIKFVYI